jgi:hypothetical protein
MSISPIGAVSPFQALQVVGPIAAAAPAGVSAATMMPDSLSISPAGHSMLAADLLALAVFGALSSGPKKEKHLLADLLIAAAVLKAMSDSSPFIQVSMIDGEAVYSLSGSVSAVGQAMASGSVAGLFSGGAAGMFMAMGGGGAA